MPGLHPLRDRPEPGPGPYGHDQTVRPVETFKGVAGLVAAFAGSISILGVVGGISEGWLTWLAPVNAYAAIMPLAFALALMAAAYVLREDVSERARATGLAATAALLLVGGSAIWLGQPAAIGALKEAAADCRERQAAAVDARGANAFEIGRDFQKSDCPGTIEAAENL